MKRVLCWTLSVAVWGSWGCSTSSTKRGAHYIPGEEPSDSGLSGSDDTGKPQGDDTGAPGNDSRFAMGPVHTCDDPQDSVTYEEVGAAMGLEGQILEALEHTEGGSVAVADLDGDSDLDVVLSYQFQPATLYVREGDVFEPMVLPTLPDILGLSLVDIDADGDLDIAVGGRLPEILRNEPDGWVQEPLPLHEHGSLHSVTKNLIPGDIDNDGDLDLYAIRSGYGEGYELLDFLYINDGTGTFTVDLNQVPESERFRRGFDAKWVDIDGDGWREVYVVNERFSPDAPDPERDGTFLLRNTEGQLSRDDGSCHCEVPVDGMGVDIWDFDEDGRPDIYVSASMSNVLLQQLADNSYVDATLVRSADPLDGTLLTMAWGGVFLDFDNDGLRDLMVAEGDLWHEHSIEPVVVDLPIDLLQFNEGESGATYRAVGAEMGLNTLGSWRSIVAVDHNGDGVVDPLVTDVALRPHLYMSQGCTSNGWLRVEAPIHSKVEVTAGGRTQIAWVDTHSSFAGSTMPEVHFGLGDAETVSKLAVTLPYGERIETTEAFSARRLVVVSADSEI